jgi:hypothetical protein
LTKQLHDDFKVEYREEGAPLRPDDTNLKRVLPSWMQINLLGIAARFVSGYYYFDMDEQLTNYMRGWTFYTGNWLVGFRSYHGTGILIFQLLQVRTSKYDASFGRYSGSTC